MRSLKVVQWGLGAMGSMMARLVTEKESLDLVGAVASRKEKIGQDVGLTIGLGHEVGIQVKDNIVDAIMDSKPDVVLHARNSFLSEASPEIKQSIKHNVNVITIAEELAFPWATNIEESRELDNMAKNHGVTVFGTGINPGFVLDLLVVMLTGISARVKKIEAKRINDLSSYGPTVMRTQGVGTTPEEFQVGIKDGSIVGHVGFVQSTHMIARALNWSLDEVVETREPIISNVLRKTEFVKVKPGMVAGCRHIAFGKVRGETRIVLEHPQQIHPELEGVDTGDYIRIAGEPDISLQIVPEIPGGIGTVAIAVNMIPFVCEAKPGLLSALDFPVPRSLKCIGD
ncbi:MAG: 2,4-diaminopentanoate dehydrogenase [Actinobacteria bacterium]|nr:2,4-diaminopentanoate dehydrogenase [Actinomycetota bacterium]